MIKQSQSQWRLLDLTNFVTNDADLTHLKPPNQIEPPNVELNNRGLNYGDGFFTTMAVETGDVYWLSYHIARVASHAKALSLSLSHSAIEALRQDLEQQAQRLENGVMKLLITRAPQSIRGYGFETFNEGSLYECWLQTTASSAFSAASKLSLPDGRQVKIQVPIIATCLSSQIACLPSTLAGLKTLNRLDSVLAAAELQRLQRAMISQLPSEGMVRDMTGVWVEGTMSNLFYQLNDEPQWLTPPLDCSGVRGVMRSVIIDSFGHSQRPIVERRLTDDELPHLTGLFFCNAVRGIMPVSELMIDESRRLSLSKTWPMDSEFID